MCLQEVVIYIKKKKTKPKTKVHKILVLHLSEYDYSDEGP